MNQKSILTFYDTYRRLKFDVFSNVRLSDLHHFPFENDEFKSGKVESLLITRKRVFSSEMRRCRTRYFELRTRASAICYAFFLYRSLKYNLGIIATSSMKLDKKQKEKRVLELFSFLLSVYYLLPLIRTYKMDVNDFKRYSNSLSSDYILPAELDSDIILLVAMVARLRDNDKLLTSSSPSCNVNDLYERCVSADLLDLIKSYLYQRDGMIDVHTKINQVLDSSDAVIQKEE